MELKSNLSNVKVGDKVFSTIDGWGIVALISGDIKYHINVKFENYYSVFTLDGKINDTDKYPALFTYNPFEQKRFDPRWMLVSSDGISWKKRYVIGKEIQYKYVAYTYTETEEESSTILWEYAKEIEEIKISMEEAIEELAKLKRVDKSLIKIKL